jgi:hypothetical protein
VTPIIFTIGVIITGFTALMTLADDVAVMRSPKRSSNTKFLPMNLFSRPCALTCLAYSMIPPLS